MRSDLILNQNTYRYQKPPKQKYGTQKEKLANLPEQRARGDVSPPVSAHSILTGPLCNRFVCAILYCCCY